MILKTIPELETERLKLRRLSYKDIDDLFKMRKDPRMHEFTDTKPDESLGETRRYIDNMNKGVDENKWLIWAIEHKEDHKVIGSISLWNFNEAKDCAELGYGIIPDYQGKGYMRETLKSIMQFGIEDLKLKAIEAYTEENNISSKKLLEGCGFIEVNRVDEEGYNNDKVYHMIVYRVEKSI